MESKLNRHKELGRFIHSKRNKMLPNDFYSLGNSRRRTPGLRREEVAFLANIGVSWYTWLEQGKPIKVSRKVLESICVVLNLTRNEIEYVFLLADLAPPRVHSFCDGIGSSCKNMLDSLIFSPAFVIDRFFNIIYWNKCFELIFSDINLICEKERNLILIAFTNESYRVCCSDWKKTARDILSQFRISYSKCVEDPRFSQILKKLKEKSIFFNECWNESYVSPEKFLKKTVNHPEIGELAFEQTSYILDADDHNFLKVYIETPILDTDTEMKIRKYIEHSKAVTKIGDE